MPKTVAILVLGSIGQTQRTMNHAVVAAEKGYNVHLIGYNGAKLYRKIMENKNIKLHYIKNPPFKTLPHFVALILLPLLLLYRFIFISMILLRLCFEIDVLIVQNPPAHPTFLVALIFKLISPYQFIIDWHNIGFTILALRLGTDNILVKIYKKFEFWLGSKADAHLCVTKAMKSYLKERLGTNRIYVLRDEPNELHRRASVSEVHSLLKLYAEQISRRDLVEGMDESRDETLMTFTDNGIIKWRPNRPILIISSTSWTLDENFEFLLNAVKNLDTRSNGHRFLFLITGKGSLRGEFERKVEKTALKNVRIVCLWLNSFEHYSLLLGSCDAGVSLHYSSSGLDFPMKVMDMFGCGLPVYSINFKCVNEVIKENINGFIFSSPEELSEKLYNHFIGLEQKDFAKCRLNLENEIGTNNDKWSRNWIQCLQKITNKME